MYNANMSCITCMDIYDHSSYYILDSLIPASADEDESITESMLRLENLSACAVVENVKAYNSLCDLPILLHKIIWKAYLEREFYEHRERIENHFRNGGKERDEPKLLLDGLPNLLYHWPHQEFVLNEVMPKFPPRIHQYHYVYYQGYDGYFSRQDRQFNFSKFDINHQSNRYYLISFYKEVVGAIINIFKKKNCENIELKYRGDIRKINLSGFYIFNWHSFKKDVIHMQCPFLDEIELVVDMDIQDEIEDVLGLGETGIETLQHSIHHRLTLPKFKNSVQLIFGQVHISSPFEIEGDFDHDSDPFESYLPLIQRFASLFEILLCTEPSSIVLHENIECYPAIHQILSHNANLKNIKAISIHGQDVARRVAEPSLNFLQNFQELIDLDLTGLELHGKLEPLRHMPKGLFSLNLSYCGLKNEDIAQLSGSIHQSTLRELNLTYNLENERCGSNLIELCKNLNNILILNLGSCDLNFWEIIDITLLVDALKILPKIAILNLSGNEFSRDIILSHMIELNEISTLKYLRLCTTTYEVFEEVRTNLNKNRPQILFVDP